MAHRDRTAIIAAILDTTTTMSSNSDIVYKARMSFNQIRDYMPLLLERGMVEKTNRNDCEAYLTTEVGRKYLTAYKQIMELMGDGPKV